MNSPTHAFRGFSGYLPYYQSCQVDAVVFDIRYASHEPNETLQLAPKVNGSRFKNYALTKPLAVIFSFSIFQKKHH